MVKNLHITPTVKRKLMMGRRPSKKDNIMIRYGNVRIFIFCRRSVVQIFRVMIYKPSNVTYVKGRFSGAPKLKDVEYVSGMHASNVVIGMHASRGML